MYSYFILTQMASLLALLVFFLKSLGILRASPTKSKKIDAQIKKIMFLIMKQSFKQNDC